MTSETRDAKTCGINLSILRMEEAYSMKMFSTLRGKWRNMAVYIALGVGSAGPKVFFLNALKRNLAETSLQKAKHMGCNSLDAYCVKNWS